MAKCIDCRNKLKFGSVNCLHACGVTKEEIDDPRLERDCETFKPIWAS